VASTHFLFPVPFLKDLVLLHICSWYILGIQLSLPEDKLGEIERNDPGDEQSCINRLVVMVAEGSLPTSNIW